LSPHSGDLVRYFLKPAAAWSLLRPCVLSLVLHNSLATTLPPLSSLLRTLHSQQLTHSSTSLTRYISIYELLGSRVSRWRHLCSSVSDIGKQCWCGSRARMTSDEFFAVNTDKFDLELLIHTWQHRLALQYIQYVKCSECRPIQQESTASVDGQ
jgi:hypothetical protein